MLTNLPAFSGQLLAAFVLADFLILALFFIAAGPLFVLSRDMFGRPVEVSWRGKIAAVAMLFLFLAYFALQVVLVARFLPYEFDNGVTVTEVISAHQVVKDPDGETAYWIVTTDHRFGVSPDVYDQLNVGDLVEFHFRPADDTLYTVIVVRHANEPAPSATARPTASDYSKP